MINISLHFFPLSFISFSAAHEWIASRSDWSVEISFLESDSEIETSSTYFQLFVLVDLSSKSLIITRNRTGPTTRVMFDTVILCSTSLAT